jgi:hypothetical protein
MVGDQMNSNNDFLFSWGDLVRLKDQVSTPEDLNINGFGSICGIRKLNGANLYLVEFGSGLAIEVVEDNLQKY